MNETVLVLTLLTLVGGLGLTVGVILSLMRSKS